MYENYKPKMVLEQKAHTTLFGNGTGSKWSKKDESIDFYALNTRNQNHSTPRSNISNINIKKHIDFSNIEGAEFAKHNIFTRLVDVFREETSVIQQMDMDFPDYKAIEAKREEGNCRVSPVGSYSVDFDLLSKLFNKQEKEIKKAEKFTTFKKTQTENFLNKKTQNNYNSRIDAINMFFNKHITAQVTQNKTISMCQDQDGSRFIQNMMDNMSEKEIYLFFNEIEENALDLATNLFGNYVIQKVIPLLCQEQIVQLTHKFQKTIHTLSTHVYGCRVIQKLIDYIDEIDFIIDELQEHVLELIASPNGNHVVQKCIDRAQSSSWSTQFIRKITVEFEKDCINLAQQRYGCRVLQRLFELNAVLDVQHLLNLIVDNLDKLINDRYGNYVIQHLIQSDFDQRNDIFNYIISNAVELSKFKFSSNVIEKCVCNANKKQLEMFLKTFSAVQKDGKPSLFHMCTDMYANYVVQKFYDTVDKELKEKMKVLLGRYLKDIKVIPFTKHILSKLN